jgi:hypothetical protein
MVETGQVEQDEHNYRHNEHHRAGEYASASRPAAAARGVVPSAAW